MAAPDLFVAERWRDRLSPERVRDALRAGLDANVLVRGQPLLHALLEEYRDEVLQGRIVGSCFQLRVLRFAGAGPWVEEHWFPPDSPEYISCAEAVMTAESRYLPVIELALRLGADPNAPFGRRREDVIYPLDFAVLLLDRSLGLLLIEAGAYRMVLADARRRSRIWPVHGNAALQRVFRRMVDWLEAEILAEEDARQGRDEEFGP